MCLRFAVVYLYYCVWWFDFIRLLVGGLCLLCYDLFVCCLIVYAMICWLFVVCFACVCLDCLSLVLFMIYCLVFGLVWADLRFVNLLLCGLFIICKLVWRCVYSASFCLGFNAWWICLFIVDSGLLVCVIVFSFAGLCVMFSCLKFVSNLVRCGLLLLFVCAYFVGCFIGYCF